MTKKSPFTVKLAVKSLNLTKKLTQLILTDGGFGIIEPDDSSGVDLLVFELGLDAGREMETIQSLISSGEVTEVFLTADHADSGVLMQAMRSGVKEFVPQPIDAEEFRQALLRFKQRRQALPDPGKQSAGQVLTVFGSKGGVGTTTVSVNLAVALADSAAGPSVALLDMNTLFGEIPLFLEISPKFHWGEITKNIDRLDDTFLSNILTEHRSGVKVLPSPAYLNGHVKPSPDTMSRILLQMKRMFDYVIVDGGQSTEEASLKVLEITDRLLLITILSLPCLANASKLLRSFTDLGYIRKEQIEVVLNRYMRKSDISLKDAEAGIGKKLFWTIPNDYGATMAAINNGRPLAQIAPRAPITKSFGDLAGSLAVPGEANEPKKRRFFSKPA
jgi:pilus assembly protein CpaE